jgi:putative transcriptional regulator
MAKPVAELRNDVPAVRRSCGLTQTELARAVKVSRQTISSIERGDYNPSTSLALRISIALGVSVDNLFSLPEPICAELMRCHRNDASADKERIG